VTIAVGAQFDLGVVQVQATQSADAHPVADLLDESLGPVMLE